MRSRTPPISSEFGGGGGLNTPNPPRYATAPCVYFLGVKRNNTIFLSFSLVLVFYKEYKNREARRHVILSLDTQHNVGQVSDVFVR